MDEHPTSAKNDHEALKRIVVLLLALADLAERASLRSRPIRCLVLWILRPAEAYARDFVMRVAHDLGAPANLAVFSLENHAAMIGSGGQGATDAVRLALSFRMLAAQLDGLAALALAQRRTLPHASLTSLLTGFSPAFTPDPLRSLDWPVPAYPDTS